MTIKERAIEYSANKSQPYGRLVGYTKGATDQRQIDLNAVELVLYNAVEIGDVTCKDVKKLIESIKVAMANPPKSTL